MAVWGRFRIFIRSLNCSREPAGPPGSPSPRQPRPPKQPGQPESKPPKQPEPPIPPEQPGGDGLDTVHSGQPEPPMPSGQPQPTREPGPPRPPEQSEPPKHPDDDLYTVYSEQPRPPPRSRSPRKQTGPPKQPDNDNNDSHMVQPEPSRMHEQPESPKQPDNGNDDSHAVQPEPSQMHGQPESQQESPKQPKPSEQPQPPGEPGPSSAPDQPESKQPESPKQLESPKPLKQSDYNSDGGGDGCDDGYDDNYSDGYGGSDDGYSYGGDNNGSYTVHLGQPGPSRTSEKLEQSQLPEQPRPFDPTNDGSVVKMRRVYRDFHIRVRLIRPINQLVGRTAQPKQKYTKKSGPREGKQLLADFNLLVDEVIGLATEKLGHWALVVLDPESQQDERIFEISTRKPLEEEYDSDRSDRYASDESYPEAGSKKLWVRSRKKIGHGYVEPDYQLMGAVRWSLLNELQLASKTKWTNSEIRQEAQRIWRRQQDYRLLNNNCQRFCILLAIVIRAKQRTILRRLAGEILERQLKGK